MKYGLHIVYPWGEVWWEDPSLELLRTIARDAARSPGTRAVIYSFVTNFQEVYGRR